MPFSSTVASLLCCSVLPTTMWMLGVLLWLALLSFAPSGCVAEDGDSDSAPTPVVVRKAGYRCEVHTVTTEDGYILTIHRIPGGLSSELNSSLPPVFLHHGILESSFDWVLTGPGQSLGYILADLGYDVWLGNARGNAYSRNHTTLSTDSENLQYWNFTWHEMGYYDLPAAMDYVLEVTGHRQLHYVGHSMGTTMFFVLCATRPEYNAKILSMHGLAPIVFMGHVTSPIRLLAPFSYSIEVLALLVGWGEFLPRTNSLNTAFKVACEQTQLEERFCQHFLFIICGYDPEQMDEKLVPLILDHTFSGQSTKTLLHYAQEINTDLFQQYDYGVLGNLAMYNSVTPPQYNLSCVTVPASLHYGDNDLLAVPKGVKKLFKCLKNPVGLFRTNFTLFNHLDFLWGKDVKTLVYDQVIYLMKKFEDENVRCVKPKRGIRNGVVEFEARPCSAKLVVENASKGEIKSFLENSPLLKNPVSTLR